MRCRLVPLHSSLTRSSKLAQASASTAYSSCAILPPSRPSCASCVGQRVIAHLSTGVQASKSQSSLSLSHHVAPQSQTHLQAKRDAAATQTLSACNQANTPSRCETSRQANATDREVVQMTSVHKNNKTIPIPAPQHKSLAIHPALIDSFGRSHTYLRISLTEKCNLRCQYCMPQQGVELTPAKDTLTNKELQRLIRIFVELGVNKIRFTGGEPLVRRDFAQIVAMAGQFKIKRPSWETKDSIQSQSSKLNSGEHACDFEIDPNYRLPVGRGLHTIAVTTNGLVLARQLDRLVAEGLNHVNISLDTMDPHMFTLITRRLGHDRVVKAILASCANRGLRAVKVNCVAIRGLNCDQVVPLAELSLHAPIEVRFIEYMPFDGNRWAEAKFISMSEMIENIKQNHPRMKPMNQATSASAHAHAHSQAATPETDAKIASARTEDHNARSNSDPIQMNASDRENHTNAEAEAEAQFEADSDADADADADADVDADGTSKLWRLHEHAVGRVGFISSMSSHFCSTCSRLRLQADGALKVCLFGQREISLRDAMRSGATDGELIELIQSAVLSKARQHGGMLHLASEAEQHRNRPMIKIGG